MKKGEYKQAIADFTQAIIADFTQAIDRTSDDDTSKAAHYSNRGIAYFGKGESDHAIADFTQAIDRSSDNKKATYYRNRGLAYYFGKGEYKQAIADFTQAIIAYFTQAIDRTSNDDNKKAAHYSNRGLAYFGKGEYDRAIADFTQAINRTSDDDTNKAIYYNNRAFAYHDKGEQELAKKDWEETRRIWFAKETNASELHRHGQKIARYHPSKISRITALARRELWIANPKTFNDPFDSQILQKILHNYKELHEVVESVRIAAFERVAPKAQDTEQRRNVVRNVALWAYYANAHKGFCALYTFQDHKNNQLCWRKVDYRTENEISLSVDLHGTLFDSAFMQKHEDWKHENELRLLHYTTDSTDESDSKPSLIVPGKGALIPEEAVGIKLSAIYFGYRMDTKTCAMIHATINHQRSQDNIKFYRIKQSKSRKHQNKPLVLVREPYPPRKPRKHRNSPVNSQ